MIQISTYSVATKYKVHNNTYSKMPWNFTLKRVKYSPEKLKEKNKWKGKPCLRVERPNIAKIVIPHSSIDLMQSSSKTHQVLLSNFLHSLKLV